MNKDIARLLGNSRNNLFAEKQIIREYLSIKHINYMDNSLLQQYLSDDMISTSADLDFSKIKLNTMNDLLLLMEQLVSDDDKKVNGVVYTPFEIKRYMITEMNIHINDEIVKICDPSCGCGSFLVSIADHLHCKHNLSFQDIFERYIYGVDILEHNIIKAKVLLTILALEYGENYNDAFNLIVGNSLEIEWSNAFPDVFNNGGFNYVVGNPPYVSLKNMSEEVKQSLKKWETAKYGNTDLYIVFYELALKLIKYNGIIGYITINSFFTSLNAKGLRKLIKDSNVSFTIYNFADKQLFSNVQSYTCISIIKKWDKSSIITKFDSEIASDGVISADKRKKVCIDLRKYSNDTWLLISKCSASNIKKIQSFKRKLSDFTIKNGIATLKNDVYIFTPTTQDNIYFYFSKNGKEYRVEKSICRSIIKPNILKAGDDIATKLEQAIFPYKKNNTDELTCYAEDEFKIKFPYAYLYLSDHKAVLSNRDKGKKIYEEWFAYGRRQGLQTAGIKVLIPYIAATPFGVISSDNDLLYYCGYAIYVKSDREAIFVKKILESSVFNYYIHKTSKPYSSGYYSLAKAYIKDFSIPDFSQEEYEKIILSSQEETDSILIRKYNINI